jgi:hypothetical protein
MAGESAPALEVFFPILRGNQRQDRVIVGSAQDLNDALILQVPEQFATFDNAVNALLEFRVCEGLEQSSGEGKMNAAHVLIGPERPRNAVQGKEELLGGPFLRGEQGLEVTGGLMKV